MMNTDIAMRLYGCSSDNFCKHSSHANIVIVHAGGYRAGPGCTHRTRS